MPRITGLWSALVRVADEECEAERAAEGRARLVGMSFVTSYASLDDFEDHSVAS